MGVLVVRKHSRRCTALKAIVTGTIVGAIVVHPSFSPIIAVAGNLLWLWADFD